ncbi:MAG: hypothetical protein PHR16_10285 [Methylovulum sp.]|nr:hypothetical protein [Methylovulum sp.]
MIFLLQVVVGFRKINDTLAKEIKIACFFSMGHRLSNGFDACKRFENHKEPNVCLDNGTSGYLNVAGFRLNPGDRRVAVLR